MDIISRCKDKLAYFRMKELKDVLTQIGGVSKQGKKQELTDRIVGLLSDEQASKVHGGPKKNPIGKEGIVKIIDDTYRKMQIPGAIELASKKQTDSDTNGLNSKEELDASLQLEAKVKCLCRSSLPTESMIQCQDARCNVWQHIGCVIVQDKPTELPPVPSSFYCEMCRIKRADPFWVTVDSPLEPVKLYITSLPTDGATPIQSVEKTFTLTRAHRDLLQKADFDVQVWCMLLNDKVTFRMQWPQSSDLQVNGVPVRTVNRPGTQLLGANGRDDGPIITACTREGTNRILLSGCDARTFCVGVRITRRRTVEQVLRIIPKESDGESFDDALARVCRCVGGGNAAENADSDSDIEVVAESITVNLRCPLSGSRIKIAGRFKPCAHMGCFDLEIFVELNQRSRKWQCPICLKNYSLEHVIIDPYFNRITTLMRDCGEDVNEIDVKPDGSWRVKNEHEHKDLARWHSPSGSLYAAVTGEVKPDVLKSEIKEEVLSEGHHGLKPGTERNRHRIWEVIKPKESKQTQNSENQILKFDNRNVIPMSNSATGSSRDGEDPSVNQECGGHFDISANNGNELDAISLNFDPTYATASTAPSAPSRVSDVIVLSDSDEENENLTANMYESHHSNIGSVPFSLPPSGNLDSYTDDPHLGAVGNSLGLLNGNCVDYGMPLWPLSSNTQPGPGFQLFGTDTNVSGSFIDLERASDPISLNGYGLASDITMRSVTQVPNPNLDLSLIDNPLAYGADDPSLQIFLSPHPANSSVQTDVRDQPDKSNCKSNDDWISLSLGGGGSASNISIVEPGTSDGLNSRHQVAPKEAMDSSTITASLLPDTTNDRPERTSTKRQMPDSFFSHPRQPRSARPRYLPSD